MSEVIYTDLSKYVIIHMHKWVDPRTHEIHRVEYRWCRYLAPATGRYLDRWEDGKVESLSMREFATYVNRWKNDAEYSIPQQVVAELINPTYEVVIQFQTNEGGDRHLNEIRQYAPDDHQLWRDRHLLKRLNPEEFASEQQLQQFTVLAHRIRAGAGTARQLLSSEMA